MKKLITKTDVYTIYVSTEENRLYITLSGKIDVEEAELTVQKVVQEVNKLKSGFDVINNLTYYKSGNPKAGIILQNTVKYLQSQNVNRVVRVIGGSKAGLVQFARFTQFFKNYKIIHVTTLEEAEKKLDNK